MDTSDPGLAERLSLIASEEALARIGARVDDLADPDVRAVVIRSDHPRLDRALCAGEDMPAERDRLVGPRGLGRQ